MQAFSLAIPKPLSDNYLAALATDPERLLRERVRALLGDRHQRELAKAIGVAEGTLSQFLNGRHTISIGKLGAMAEFFSVGIGDLFASDLSGHGSTGPSAGGSPLEAGLLEELEHARATAGSAVAQLRQIADALEGAAAKTQRASSGKARRSETRRRHDRKTA